MLIFLLIEAKNLSIRRGGRFYFLTRVPILHRGKVAEKEVFDCIRNILEQNLVKEKRLIIRSLELIF